MEVQTFADLQFVIKKPKNFDPTKKYPCLLMLHGSGTRGRDIDVLISHPFFEITKKFEDFPFVVIAPQCYENTWFNFGPNLHSLCLHVLEMPFIDNDRFYMMGASMGGYCTWSVAQAWPELFAAIVPICGGGVCWNAYQLEHVPVWAFHGAKDDCVMPSESANMVDAVNKAGGNAKLTIYPENGHDAWSDTFGNKEVFDWLLSHKKYSAENEKKNAFSYDKVLG